MHGSGHRSINIPPEIVENVDLFDELRLAEEKSCVTFVCSYPGKCTFVRSFTTKKPLLSTVAKGVFSLFLAAPYGMMIPINQDIQRYQRIGI